MVITTVILGFTILATVIAGITGFAYAQHKANEKLESVANSRGECKRRESIVEYFDSVAHQAACNTKQMRTAFSNKTQQFENSVSNFNKTSCVIKEEGENYKKLVTELKEAIATREKQLTSVTEALKNPLVTNLKITEQQTNLQNRQQELVETIHLFKTTMVELKLIDEKLVKLNKKIKTLESEEGKFSKTRHTIYEQKLSLLSQVENTNDQLKNLIKTNEILKSTNYTHEQTIKLLREHIESLTLSSSPNLVQPSTSQLRI